MSTTPQLPLEIWFQILNQTLNHLLPTATTPRLYSTYIVPLLLTSHTFHEHCHPVTYPHLRKHRLLQLFTRWKAAHSREVHFYHHPLRTHVRYALPDRVGNPPGEEYETLYSFIKRSYLFGCESVCGTVIPVEGGLEGPIAMTTPTIPAAAGTLGQEHDQEQAHGIEDGAATNATAANTSAPVSTATSTGAAPAAGNVVIAPPPAPATMPQVTHHGGDGGGQGWKGHALQWHVANPTFAAEGTIELYRDVVEEYRRVVCGSAAARERSREIERVMDMIKNPERYADISAPASEMEHELAADTVSGAQSERIMDIEEEDEGEDIESEEDDREDGYEDVDDDEEIVGRDTGGEEGDELLNEIEAKGGLRRRDSGHGQSSSEMDVDEDRDEEESMMDLEPQGHLQEQQQEQQPSSTKADNGTGKRVSKRESEPTAMDYQLEEEGTSTRLRRGLRSRKSERSTSSSEQERMIMDMALDKQYRAPASFAPLNIVEPGSLPPLTSSSSSKATLLSASPSASTSSGVTRSGSPAPFSPMMRKSRDCLAYGRSKTPRGGLQRSHSSPGATMSTRSPKASHYSGPAPVQFAAPSSAISAPSPLDIAESHTSSTSAPAPATTSTRQHSADDEVPSLNSSTSSCTHQQIPPPPPSRPLRAEDLDFDLASACANTFASDLAFVLARVPGLGAHFHRFEQLAKLKLHVGWAKHAQSRGGNDVFVMSCSRLIGLLAPLANTPLVSERGG
ncbi:hypothetical protein BGZ70_000988 [Mortierella alpina]|uniref:Uncharacterized protein n=1 Tax=Mortierella alpina TaxID=64518 RepID=A0A9P6IWR8_MORAP|nr:hypothetical protein BGZ70_000988 [Mortierella alpina]